MSHAAAKLRMLSDDGLRIVMISMGFGPLYCKLLLEALKEYYSCPVEELST